jgi:DNA-binding GntR family transcriptional regulator
MGEERKNLMEKAYRQIKNMIFSQKLASGQKLIFRDLSQRLNMSKTPIMYALGRLEQEEIIRLEPNQGHFVKEIDLNEIEDLFVVREALEALAINFAIKKQTKEEIKKLEEQIRQHAKYKIPVYDRKKLLLDFNLHLQIASMSKNNVLFKQIRQIFERLFLRCRVERMDPARLAVSSLEHKQILTMMRKKDSSGAEKAIRNHVEAAKQSMILSISREDSLDTSSLFES